MEPIKLNARETILLLTLIGIGIGVLFGLVPLIYGRIKGQKRLGVIGFFSSVLAGAIWSVLPLVVMLTFAFLIIRSSNKSASSVIPSKDTDDETSDVDSQVN